MTSYPTGQAVRISTGTITTDVGATDPATLDLTITLPDLSTVGFAIADFTRVSTGVYYYDYLPPTSGHYDWRIVATGPNTAAEGTFTVDAIGSHYDDPVGLEEAKAELNITSTVDDDELQRMLDAALVQIGHAVGPLTVQTIVEDHMYPGDAIIPRKRPVVSLTSVALQWDCNILPADPGTWVLVNDIVRWRPPIFGYGLFGSYSSWWQPWLATITYQAGWGAPLPADLRMAVLELVRWLAVTQSGSRIAQNPGQPPMRDQVMAGVPVAFDLLPSRVKTLVSPYRPGARGIG